MDLEAFKPLADVLLEKGVPLLANMLVPGIGGTIASAVVPSIAEAFGLSSTASPSEVAATVAADPDAVTKLEAVKDKHRELLQFAEQTLTDNQGALALEPTFAGRLFVGGWRPAMGWVGVLSVIYQIFASVLKLTLLPTDIFAIALGAWTALAGVRGIEMVKGVAHTTLSTMSAVSAVSAVSAAKKGK